MVDNERAPATLEEVYEAIEALGDNDYAALYARAVNMLYGTRYRDPVDLVHDAMHSAIEGATPGSARGRLWPKAVTPFIAFVTVAMKGIASNSRTSAAGRAEVLAVELVGAEGGDSDAAMAAVTAASTSGVDQELMESADAAELLRQRDELFAEFSSDDEITMILMAMEDGLRGEDIRHAAGMDQTTYETARRRLRRGVAKFRAKRSAE
ncbi:MAG: hypothetical protein KGJ51_12395 [Acidobacteriota bacterium]|nr:hypothetical protein [Acidobacteriota bacterium]